MFLFGIVEISLIPSFLKKFVTSYYSHSYKVKIFMSHTWFLIRQSDLKV